MSSNTANLTHYHPRTPRRTPEDYLDLLGKQRPRAKHPMSPDARAAQFAPYAALVGYQDIIDTDEQNMQTKVDLDREILIDSDEETDDNPNEEFDEDFL